MRTDGRTGMTKLIVAFLNFENAPKSSLSCPLGIRVVNVNKDLRIGSHRCVFVNNEAPRDKMTHVAWLCHADRSCHSFAYLFVYTGIPLCQHSGREGLQDYLRDGINNTSSLLCHSKFLFSFLVTTQMRV